MAEWSIAHAWKLIPFARADAHQIPPTHFRSTTSRNNDRRQRVPVNHKLRNLQAKAPARLREELTEDYRRMIYGETVTAIEQARLRFTKKWRLRCAAVVESLDEAGDELFTVLRFPSSQWKALRTTNALERINGEFRRRTKTQASLPSQDAVLLLLFGLLRSGQVKLRALVGYHDMEPVKKVA